MNVGTTITLMLTLMLALALAAIGDSTRSQADVSNSSLAVRGNNLNHNETLVRDTQLIQTSDWRFWLNSEQSFTQVPILAYFLSYRCGLTFSPLICGSNHNETLVNDKATTQQADDWSSWLNSEQSFTDVPLLAYFLSYRAGLSCSPLVCGTNHNETLVNDEASTQQADDWSLWLNSEQSFTDVSLLAYFLSYRSGVTCSPIVCGSNHNETLVNDEATTEQEDDWNRWQPRKQSFLAAQFLRGSCAAGLALVPTVVVQPKQDVRAVGRTSALAADE